MTNEQTVKLLSTQKVSFLGLLLGIFAAVSSLLLAVGNVSTEKTIELRMAEDLKASLSQVIPADIHDNNLLDNKINIQNEGQELTVYQALKKNRLTALAYEISNNGFSGEIKLILGINVKGEVLGVRVLSHTETPGLGDKIEEGKSDWIYRFNSKSLKNLTDEQWQVKKDGGYFDQFSGATITPRAVVAAIKHGLEIYRQQRDEMLFLETKDSTAKDALTNKPLSEASKHE